MNFYPLVDFVQLRYLHIKKSFSPLSSFSLCNCHRSAEFLYKSLRFLHHVLWPFRRHIDSKVCKFFLTCVVANLVKRAGLCSRKTYVRFCRERLWYVILIHSYIITYIILFYTWILHCFFLLVRECLTRVYAYHFLIPVIWCHVAQAVSDFRRRVTHTAPVIGIARSFQQLQKVFDWLWKVWETWSWTVIMSLHHAQSDLLCSQSAQRFLPSYKLHDLF